MNQIRVEVGVADLIQEEAVLDSIKRLTDVDGDRGSTERRFLLVETGGDPSDGREESSGGRVAGAETVLRRRRRERRGQEREDKTLKNLRSGAKEGDGAVRGRVQGGFTGFRDRDYEGLFPDRGEVRGLYRKVKERSKEGDGATTEVF